MNYPTRIFHASLQVCSQGSYLSHASLQQDPVSHCESSHSIRNYPLFFSSGGGGASVAKTLDLLKAVLQPSFNMEVKRLCDDYRHIYAIAASNIRENTGDTVPQSTLKLLIMKMIEEVQK